MGGLPFQGGDPVHWSVCLVTGGVGLTLLGGVCHCGGSYPSMKLIVLRHHFYPYVDEITLKKSQSLKMFTSMTSQSLL